MFRGRSTSTEALTPAALHAFADANCVIEAFRAVAQVRRDSPAIIENGRVTTYAELAAKTQIVASQLGENCGTVAVLTTRSANTIVALLGVLTAGGILLPRRSSVSGCPARSDDARRWLQHNNCDGSRSAD